MKKPKTILPELGGGRIDIPGSIVMPVGPWLAPKPFALTRRHMEWIRRYQDMPWISRAMTESFWQCLRCGWRPWLNEDDTADSVWNWFSGLPAPTRVMLVSMSRSIQSDVHSGKRKIPFRSERYRTDRPAPVDRDNFERMVSRN